MTGVLNIDKPSGLTSHDVVARVRQMLKVKSQRLVKVGHTGTLDPFATGVLLVVIGSATRLIQFTHAWDKEYLATIVLGATSDTDDMTGIISKSKIQNPNQISKSEIQKILENFIGTITQIPPAYSAIKIHGKKMYELARVGNIEELKKIGESKRRHVTVHAIELVEYRFPELTLRVRCSTGTYIRSLARDIGEHLNVGAYVSSLRRTRIGQFDIEKSLSLDKLSTGTPQHLLSPDLLVADLPHYTLTSQNIKDLQQGKGVALPQKDRAPLPTATPIALVNEQQHLTGIGQISATTHLLLPLINLA